MVCDCTLPSKEDLQMGFDPCGDDCINRMLFIEWCVPGLLLFGHLCPEVWFSCHQYTDVLCVYCGHFLAVNQWFIFCLNRPQAFQSENYDRVLFSSGSRCPCGEICTNKRFQKVK